jgi:nitrite reductase/ring-hydroxylating ferredoxin subunit
MPAGAELTTVEAVHDEGSYLCTVTDEFDMEDEIVVVPCTDGAGASTDRDGVAAYVNRCTHEAQRFDTGRGVPMRDGQIICPKHGSLFDACSGVCDNGDAAGTTLPEIEITVEGNTIHLVDDAYEFAHAGSIEDDDGPSSTSHIGF